MLSVQCSSTVQHRVIQTLGLGEFKLTCYTRALRLLIVLCCFYRSISHLFNSIKRLCKSWSEREPERGGNPVPVSGGTMATFKALLHYDNSGFHGVQPISLPLPGDREHNALLTAIDCIVSPINSGFYLSPVTERLYTANGIQ